MRKKLLSTFLSITTITVASGFISTSPVLSGAGSNLPLTKIYSPLSFHGFSAPLLAAEKTKLTLIRKNTLGIEYKRNDSLWVKYDDNIDTSGLDEDPDEKSPLFDARYVGYLSNEDLKEYEEATKITDATKKKDTINEILGREKLLYSVVIFKKTPTQDEIKKNVKGKNVLKIGEAQGYTFYFGYDDYSDSDLKSTESKDAFKALYDDSQTIKNTLAIFKPVTSEEGIKNLKKFTFSLKDLSGKDVTEDIFKQNDLTLINIWGTYCGPCIREMPILQELSTELKSKRVGIVGLVTDAYTGSGIDENIVKKAKDLIAKNKVTYTNLLPDESVKYDGILSYVSAIPTSFFVDKDGNIVGEVRVGDGTKEDYLKLINDTLSKITNK